jgi:16S rRNA C1402 (ribose-2'-O) methylase RsmI
LIRPLRVGSTVAGGFLLRRAHVSADGLRIHYTLSPPNLEVVVERRQDSVPAAHRTNRFNVSCRSEGDPNLGAKGAAALNAIVDLVRRNETGAEDEAPADGVTGESPDVPGREADARCTLYLVPGHLGNERDLGRRALWALAVSSLIFVEVNKEATVRTLLERNDIDPTGKQIVEISHDPTQLFRPLQRFREAIERGEDTCLFGADEGIPAFFDPGRDIVLEAARMTLTVRIESIGGASAFGAVLMRAETPIEGFAFIGMLQAEPDVARFAPLLASVTEAGLPAIFFGMGAMLKRLLPPLLRSVPRLRGRVSFYCELTCSHETIRHADIPGEDATALLADEARVIVIVTPENARR